MLIEFLHMSGPAPLIFSDILGYIRYQRLIWFLFFIFNFLMILIIIIIVFMHLYFLECKPHLTDAVLLLISEGLM